MGPSGARIITVISLVMVTTLVVAATMGGAAWMIPTSGASITRVISGAGMTTIISLVMVSILGRAALMIQNEP